MTVQQAIAELSKLPADTEIITTSNNFELDGALVSFNSIRTFKATGKSKKFKDAFDGTIYTSKVWVVNENGQDVVML